MESIERITAPVATTPLEINGASDGHIATMRDFLAKPRVARDFQDLKADAHRLQSAHDEAMALHQRAAEAELEAGRIARADDDYRHHRLSFGAGVLIAALLVLLDTLPANLAAQTFGLSELPTWGITAVIVGALGAGMWAITHFKAGWRRTLTLIALAVGLLAIGALRFWFLWVTAGDVTSSILEALALTVFTTMVVFLGVLVLGFTKSRQVSASERAAYKLRRQAERKAAQETSLVHRLGADRAQFFADAQLFSFKTFQSEARRNQFLDYVRAELERS
jgi:hypothetical protein